MSENTYKIKPWVERLCQNPTLSDVDKKLLELLDYEHQHLWSMVGMFSDDEKERTQAAVDWVVSEICDKVLQEKFFGMVDCEFVSYMHYFRDCIKTHFEVCRFTERKDKSTKESKK